MPASSTAVRPPLGSCKWTHRPGAELLDHVPVEAIDGYQNSVDDREARRVEHTH